MLDVAAFRAELPLTQAMVYMNTGWSGPSPRRVIERIVEQLRYENEVGPASREVLDSHRAITAAAREAAAQLLGATADEIVLTDNTTHGINIVLTGLRWRDGDEVLTCNLEHPSIIVPVHYLPHRGAIAVRSATLTASDTAADIVAKLEAALTPRTRLLALSHITFTTGSRLPLAEINALAHRHGALVLWDAAQSVGHIAVDLAATDTDFYAFTGHKWLLGPDGAGGLFIRRDLIESIEPLFVSGAAALSYDVEHMEPRTDSVRKFDLTTRSAPLLAGFVEAARMHVEFGPATLEARAVGLAARLRAALIAIDGVNLTSSGGDTATALVAFAVAGVEPRQVTEQLWERGRIVGRSVASPAATRLAVAFFNTEDEVDRVVDVVRALVAS